MNDDERKKGRKIMYNSYDEFVNAFAEKLKDPENTVSTVEEILNSVKDLYDSKDASETKLIETSEKYKDMRVRYLEKLQSETIDMNIKTQEEEYTDADYQETLIKLRG